LKDLGSFFSVGGFVYFNEDLSQDSISFTAISQTDTESALVFGKPQQLRAELIQSIDTRFQFYPITIAAMADMGAKRYCWVPPGETFNGVIPENTDGMFVYLFHDGREGTPEQMAMNRYFCVQSQIDAADEEDDSDVEDRACAAAQPFRTGYRSSTFEESTKGIIRAPEQPPTLTESQRILQLQSQVNQLKDDKLCTICNESSKNAIFKPCNHAAACLACALKITNQNKKCPFCRKPFENFEQFYD